MMEGPRTALHVARDLLRHPVDHFIRGWNWKSAAVSSICRGGIFFCVNLPAGFDASTRALAIELAFRAVVSGVLGSATQAFRDVTPGAIATILPVLAIPAVGHTAEYAVHHVAGTARLGESIAASVAFSVLTTAFTLFAMRRGALIVGAGQQSLIHDLQRAPGLIAAFVGTMVKGVHDSVGRQRLDRDRCRYRRCT
jgi:hypothetical protein